MLSGGYKINVMPEEAEMSFDCRILPDTDEHAFVSNLEQTINDPGVHLEVSYPDAQARTSAWAENPLFEAIERGLRRLRAERDRESVDLRRRHRRPLLPREGRGCARPGAGPVRRPMI